MESQKYKRLHIHPSLLASSSPVHCTATLIGPMPRSIMINWKLPISQGHILGLQHPRRRNGDLLRVRAVGPRTTN